jgi:tripartite-type tricarboxylate transporter receptor subunit TctC
VDRDLLRFYALKFSMARPLMMPPEVPAERAAALQAAFEATMNDARYLEEARRIGLDVNWLGAKDIAALARQIDAAPQSVVDRLRESLGRAGAR